MLLDPLTGKALLTGASLAGALRSYLREREFGYGQTGQKGKAENLPLYALLFGGLRESEAGEQSPLITYDAFSNPKPEIELRDGVKLDEKTRTAQDKKKFDMELLAAGTTFPIRVELLVIQNESQEAHDREQRLRQGLALALQGLERGEIPLGGRKRRGLGQGRVKGWRVYCYNMVKPNDLINWLDNAGEAKAGDNIAALLDVDLSQFEDKRCSFDIKATFALDSSLLIRSGFGQANAPDMVHLHSKREQGDVPILSGTSLAGALRARAVKITNTLGKGQHLVKAMFGPMIENNNDTPQASRLVVGECEIENGLANLVQNRVKIDRFTGGSYPGALFNQQPLFGRPNGQTRLTIKLSLRQGDKNFEAEIGLLLLLLKDLWTGDLPLGGEAGVGRGRLQGLEVELKQDLEIWSITTSGQELQIEGSQETLENFVKRLQEVTE